MFRFPFLCLIGLVMYREWISAGLPENRGLSLFSAQKNVVNLQSKSQIGG
jgi:hypothetical protein